VALWNLSGSASHVTDASNASRTMLFDIHRGAWDDELLALLDILRRSSRAWLSSGTCAHAVLRGATVPIAGIAATSRRRCSARPACPPVSRRTRMAPAFSAAEYGPHRRALRNNLLSTVAWTRDGVTSYALEGSVFIAGAVVQWLRDGLQLVRTAQDVEALAASVPDNGGIFMCRRSPTRRAALGRMRAARYSV
jgi:glycerol kinase